MADTEDLYPSAAALGRANRLRPAQKPPRLDFIAFRLRDGTELLYEYKHVSAVMVRSHRELVIQCTCGHYDTITVTGLNLAPLAPQIAHFTLAEITETDLPIPAAANGQALVSEIILKKSDRRPSGNL